MALLTLRNVTLSFGGPPLLDGVDLQIEPGERLCLVGRNGTGKSTLMKLLNDELQSDSGEIIARQGLKVARLTQEVPRELSGEVFDVVADGLGEQGALLAEYHHVSQQLASGDEKLMGKLERIQHELEACDGWQLNQRVEAVITRLNLPAEAEFGELSGGLKRRVLLARELVREPDLLLLDEPTNHLDVAAIDWLEEFLLGWGGSLLFITHDRMFLQRLATRIIELDRGRLTSWPGDYETYLKRKAEALEAEAQQNALFDKRLAREEAWIRQGIKARRTRNEGRVRALKALREERRERRERTGKVKVEVTEAERSGKVVIEASNIGMAYEGRTLFRDFSTAIMRGDRIGILGPNGSGKTTLLQVLLGKLTPQQGKVKLGTNLEIAYFDQHRAQLDEEASVLDNVAEGSDKVTINGKTKHVMGYLQDFLFSPDRARGPVRSLSGGERNRLLLAKLFTKPANLLVMDEPTNDLDVETLELLEELLLDYQGTLLLVSHDRAFINNVVTSTIAFEGQGRLNEYVGGYDDWLRQRKTVQVDSTTELKSSKSAQAVKEEKKEPKRQAKLSYKDQRELDALPKRIEELETEVETLHGEMAVPGFYQQDGAVIAEAKEKLERLEQALAVAFERWEELEAMRSS
ncbi:MAG: ATP-binding cassette domain-containing protein [Pseudomonadota bacterium]